MKLRFSLERLWFSIIIVNYRQSFINRIDKLLRDHDSDLTADDIMSPESAGVWLVPARESFTHNIDYEAYVEQLKPNIWREEFRVAMSGYKGEHIEPYDKKLFNEYFELVHRDDACVPSDPSMKSKYDIWT